MIMKFVFWASILFIFYTYAGYPLFIAALAFFRRGRILKSTVFPQASVVIAAFNEGKNLKARLENLLAQDYPADKLEIIIVSDGSVDDTEEIVRSFQNQNVRLLALKSRKGKAAAVNYGVSQATGEILVLTDVRQIFEPDAVRQLVANFNDSAVGCVSGELLLMQDWQSRIQAEMGAYWRYEKWIRKCESRTGSAVGATGAIYAVHRRLYRPLPPGTLLDDVLTPLNIVMQGYRTVFDETAIAYDKPSRDIHQEWRRKVRTLAGNWQLVSLCPALLLPWRNPVWGRFMSHKIFRLIVPFILPILLLSGALQEGFLYRTITWSQLCIYSAASLAAMIPPLRKIGPVSLVYFFLVLNLAAVVGFWEWLMGRCETLWKPGFARSGEEL